MIQSIKKISLAALLAVGINGSTPTMTIAPQNAIMGVVGALGLTYITVAIKNEIALHKEEAKKERKLLQQHMTVLKDTIASLEQNFRENKEKLEYFKMVLLKLEAHLAVTKK